MHWNAYLVRAEFHTYSAQNQGLQKCISIGMAYTSSSATQIAHTLRNWSKQTILQVTGSFVQWQKWQFRVGFNYREGAVLHKIAYQDGGSLRPILHRMSMAEM